jgi:hypothetical protein
VVGELPFFTGAIVVRGTRVGIGPSVEWVVGGEWVVEGEVVVVEPGTEVEPEVPGAELDGLDGDL